MPVFFRQKPNAKMLSDFLAEQAHLDYSYPEVGATKSLPPAGYVLDRTRIQLGSGELVFEAAKSALYRWRQMQIGWVDVWSPDTPLEAGQDIAIVGRAVGFWWLNACRIIYTVDESGDTTRFGFGYGTLPGHVEMGEERFLIEWDRQIDQVHYDILAFSKPNHILARIGYPMVRRCQKRFGRDSSASMFKASNPGAVMPLPLQSTD